MKATEYKFRVQSAPPLSLQQSVRSSAPLHGTQEWKPSGIYRQPRFDAYLSPETKKDTPKPIVKPWIYTYKRKHSLITYIPDDQKKSKPKPVEPIWRPPGKYIEERPESFSPEKRQQKVVHEPVWRPAGKTQYKPVPYFDPPGLRWSIGEIRRSISLLSARSTDTSRNRSAIKN